MVILIDLNDARKKLNELEGSAEYNKGVTDAFNALFDLPIIKTIPTPEVLAAKPIARTAERRWMRCVMAISISQEIRDKHSEVCAKCKTRKRYAKRFDMHFDWIDCPYSCENDYEHIMAKMDEVEDG